MVVQSVQQTGSYVCIIITANPIIITKIINYPNSKLNWIIFNSLTTTLLFSPINRRLLMIRHFCHPGFQNIDHPNDIWRQAPPLSFRSFLTLILYFSLITSDQPKYCPSGPTCLNTPQTEISIFVTTIIEQETLLNFSLFSLVSSYSDSEIFFQRPTVHN